MSSLPEKPPPKYEEEVSGMNKFAFASDHKKHYGSLINLI